MALSTQKLLRNFFCQSVSGYFKTKKQKNQKKVPNVYFGTRFFFAIIMNGSPTKKNA